MFFFTNPVDTEIIIYLLSRRLVVPTPILWLKSGQKPGCWNWSTGPESWPGQVFGVCPDVNKLGYVVNKWWTHQWVYIVVVTYTYTYNPSHKGGHRNKNVWKWTWIPFQKPKIIPKNLPSFIYKLRVKESNAKQQEQKHQSQAPFRWKMSNKQLTSCLSNLLSHDSSSRGTFAFSLALSFSFASLTLSSFSSFSTFAWYVGSTPTWKNDFPPNEGHLGVTGLFPLVCPTKGPPDAYWNPKRQPTFPWHPRNIVL